MKRNASSPGFALVVVIVLTAISLTAVGVLGGFVAHGMRLSRIHLAENRCRLAAQCALEGLKVEIQDAFNDTLEANTKFDPRHFEVYRWFYEVADNGRLIGNSKPFQVTDPPDGYNGCAVRLGVRCPDGDDECPIVPIYATAVCGYPDGLTVRVTVCERVFFGKGQSRVFDYPYFVNNYGWMSGSSIVINGDMRANGNVSLSGATVNGFVYAARNGEVGVEGKVTLSSSPQIKNESTYRSSYGNRSRPDLRDLKEYNESTEDPDSANFGKDKIGTQYAYDAPASSSTIRKAYKYDSDGNLICDAEGKPVVSSDGTFTESGKAVVNECGDPISMPFVSDLDNYVEYAKNYDENGTAGKLTAPQYTYTDGAGTTHTVASKNVTAHYEGTGPSGDSTLADDGALVLIGTQSNPIVIDGPVVVDSDVVIKGYVKGQGTIYSGRNIHIIGDVKYVNGPTWSHPDADDAAVEETNAGRDMLGLVAKGNVVIGDPTSSSWHSSVDNYIKSGTSSSVVKKYACDESDANIGYPSTFQGDYTAVEQVSGLSAEQAECAPGGYSGNQFGKVRTVTTTLDTYHTETTYDWWGRKTTKRVYDTTAELQTAYDRKYYETVCDDKILSTLQDKDSRGNALGISQIDAILYNNHGIFGTPGRSGYNFNLNGSLVCRDEALIFSGNGIRFNWDFRLRRDKNPKVYYNLINKLGLPIGPQDPYVVEWKVVGELENPAYLSWGREEDDD